MWILIIKGTFEDTKLNLFLGKNRKLELQNENPERLLFTSSRAGRMGNMNLLSAQAFLGC
jgi:hypothetical protein